MTHLPAHLVQDLQTREQRSQIEPDPFFIESLMEHSNLSEFPVEDHESHWQQPSHLERAPGGLLGTLGKVAIFAGILMALALILAPMLQSAFTR